jgi:uncharacterized Ntn-hydrolase superfamily protein
MTFYIVARCEDGRSLGVAVASKFLAVGAAVPAARISVGAIATQSFCNTLYKRDALASMSAGRSAVATLEALLADDDQRDSRQVGIVDAAGEAATFSGDDCLDWAGGVTGAGFAIQGNILTGPEVVEAMRTAFLDSSGSSLPERLVQSLQAGDAAGGDRRGRQSAALLVVAETGSYTPGDDVAYDLRVDDHGDPVGELTRLLALHHVYFDRPSAGDLSPLEGELAAEVRGHLDHLGFPDLDTWAGVENYELRLVPGRIDNFVLARLREQSASRGRQP